uniref:ZW10 interacting kinetochore protein n=1 Tax=Rousettus aegyptiacus TaxID=9407 RepID=A0A7J8GJY6_ROUAE|nr:ZW10 interacting kinetochore protein [Rousettus aegyptiacus]
MEEAQRKQAQLQEALEQLQAKKQVVMEKLRTAQKQWQLQQKKHLQHLAEVSAEVKERHIGTKQEFERLYQELGTLKQQAGQEQDKLLLPETEAELPQELDLPENKPQQVTQPQEQNIGYTMESDRSVSTKADCLQPAGNASLPWLPRDSMGERS